MNVHSTATKRPVCRSQSPGKQFWIQTEALCAISGTINICCSSLFAIWQLKTFYIKDYRNSVVELFRNSLHKHKQAVRAPIIHNHFHRMQKNCILRKVSSPHPLGICHSVELPLPVLSQFSHVQLLLHCSGLPYRGNSKGNCF